MRTPSSAMPPSSVPGRLYLIATRNSPPTYFGASGRLTGSTVFAFPDPLAARSVAVGLEVHKERTGRFPRPYGGECDLVYDPAWALRELDIREIDDRQLRRMVRGSGVSFTLLDGELFRPLRVRDAARDDHTARLEFLLRLLDAPRPRRRPLHERVMIALLLLLGM